MTSNPEEISEAWRAKAMEDIVVVPPGGVGGTGDTLVQVKGYDVARFTSFGSVATRESNWQAAQDHAEALRERYLNLELGSKVLWINSQGEMGRNHRAPDGTFLYDEMCPGLGHHTLGGNRVQAAALFNREIEPHEWDLLWQMQYRAFLNGDVETALYEQWDMVFGIVGEASTTFTGPAAGRYGFMAWVNGGHVHVGWEPWHASDDEAYWNAIEELRSRTGGQMEDMDEREEVGVMMRQANLFWIVDHHTGFEIRKLCETIAEGLDSAEVLAATG